MNRISALSRSWNSRQLPRLPANLTGFLVIALFTVRPVSFFPIHSNLDFAVSAMGTALEQSPSRATVTLIASIPDEELR